MVTLPSDPRSDEMIDAARRLAVGHAAAHTLPYRPGMIISLADSFPELNDPNL